MPSDPTRAPEGVSASPSRDEPDFGAYSSPPCFLHELDPSFLGLADAPAPGPDDIPMPDASHASWSLTADADVVAPSGNSPDGASACESSATSSPSAGPTTSSR